MRDKSTAIQLMIDSGAFSAWARKTVIPLGEYVAFVHKIVKQFPKATCVNLDVIGDGKASYQNWVEMRREGLNPLPVFHIGTDERWLLRYLAKTDYVGLGNVATMSSLMRRPSLDHVWATYLVDRERVPVVKVHGFGVASFALMRRYPWFSLDSSSWMKSAANGVICIPQYRHGEWDYSKQPHRVNVSEDSSFRRVRGQHLSTLAPQVKDLFTRYVVSMGYRVGKSKVQNGERVVLEEGVINNWRPRAAINALVYLKFCETLRYPRPFLVNVRKGLLR